tara:strand:+ start:329 stop:613 length:285 start_codon:yes stop_codon:yes gene_type:complete
MATAEEHKNRMTQAEREQKMTWQEIRDDSISKLKETYDAVTSGFVEKERQAARYKICEGCEVFKPLLRQCNSCKCFMPAKTLFNNSRCPKGYWM